MSLTYQLKEEEAEGDGDGENQPPLLGKRKTPKSHIRDIASSFNGIKDVSATYPENENKDRKAAWALVDGETTRGYNLPSASGTRRDCRARARLTVARGTWRPKVRGGMPERENGGMKHGRYAACRTRIWSPRRVDSCRIPRILCDGGTWPGHRGAFWGGELHGVGVMGRGWRTATRATGMAGEASQDREAEATALKNRVSPVQMET